MPIYEFACEDCFERVDVRASIAEKEQGLSPTCPSCGSAAMRRLMTAFATASRGAPGTAAAAGGNGCCGGGCCASR